MDDVGPDHARSRGLRLPLWIGTCVLAAIALFFLWEEHRAHLLGALPYLLLLACPVIHLFMHRNHHHDPGEHAHQHGGSS